jgi:peptidoglycan hydrolase-like protein with peptidoglycan-binding domain
VAGGNPYRTRSGPNVFAQGSKGTYVATIQAALIGEGYEIVVDGVFGPNTDAAVRSFQHTNSLRPDGIVGPKTWNALLHGNPYPGKTITQALWDEYENIEWAARILRHRFEQCGHGSWTLAISAYNGGCGNNVVVHTGRVLDNWKGKIVYLPDDPRQELF